MGIVLNAEQLKTYQPNRYLFKPIESVGRSFVLMIHSRFKYVY